MKQFRMVHGKFLSVGTSYGALPKEPPEAGYRDECHRYRTVQLVRHYLVHIVQDKLYKRIFIAKFIGIKVEGVYLVEDRRTNSQEK